MKILIPLVAALAVTTVVVAGDRETVAEHCDTNIELKHSVSVDKASLRVFNEEETLYSMTDGGRLWVEGKEIELSKGEKLKVAEYTAQVVELIPEVVELVSDALGVTGKSLGMAFGEIFGSDSPIAVEMESLMASMQSRFDEVAYREGDTYTLARDNVNGIDEAFGEEFEEDIEELVARSMGAILAMVGQAIASGEGGFVQRMENFALKMEDFGNRVESDMENMGAHLEAASAEVCMEVRHIASLEQNLRDDIPDLSTYELFTPEHIRAR